MPSSQISQSWRNIGAYTLLIVITYWSIRLIQPYPEGATPWIFLDNLNLLIHEAGHLLFSFGGQALQVAGGSILQTVFPLSVTVYFGYKRDWLGLVFGIFWLGNNLINVSYYIKDAPYRRLPLLGGDAVIHDWQWLLVKYQAIEHAESIGLVVWLVGLSCLMLAIGLGLMYALTMSKEGKITTDL